LNDDGRQIVALDVWVSEIVEPQPSELRQATRRADKYRARAAENLRLALIQEVRDHHREVAQHYLRLAEKEKLPSLTR
jgi:hypothetical protein